MRTRFIASGTHLLLSAAVISVFLLLVYFVWYPGPLHELHSTFDVIKLVVAVDLVLGPLMTLIIFDIRKPRRELVRDVSIIVLVQAIALGWGVHITMKVRPVFVVFHQDTLYSVTRDDVIGKAEDKGYEIPGFWQKPRHVYTRSLDEKEAVQHVMDMLKGAPDIPYQPDRYLPMSEHREAVLENAIEVEQLQGDEQYADRLDDFLQVHGGRADRYAFFPVQYGRYKSVMGVRREDLSLVGLLAPVTTG